MTTRSHALLIFMITLLWLAATGGLWTRIALYGDSSVFIEYAVRVADGQVPHVDFYEVKPTGFVLVTWPFIQIGRLLNVPDWMSARFSSLTMLAALASACFVTVRGLLAASGKADQALRAGWLAALAIVAFRGMPEATAAGLQPKVFTLLCPIGAIAFLLSGRPLLAGALAAFTPFHWQPGALMWLIPLALCRRRPAEEQAFRRYLIGSVITVAAYGLLLVATGSLNAFLDQALFGAFGAVGSDERGSSFRVMRILSSTWTTVGWELLAAAPLILMLALRRTTELWPLAAPVLIYGVWSLLDFQGTPDVIVFTLPLIMLGGAGLGMILGTRATIATGAVLLLISLLPHTIEGVLDLKRQEQAAANYLEVVQGSERPILALGDVFLPLLAERSTIGGELFGYNLYARLQREHPGGAAGWLEDRFAEDPAGVLIGRAVEDEMRVLLQTIFERDHWVLLDTVQRTKDNNGLVVEVEIWVRES